MNAMPSTSRPMSRVRGLSQMRHPLGGRSPGVARRSRSASVSSDGIQRMTSDRADDVHHADEPRWREASIPANAAAAPIAGAEHGAETPAGVEPRHDVAAVGAFGSGARHVHADVADAAGNAVEREADHRDGEAARAPSRRGRRRARDTPHPARKRRMMRRSPSQCTMWLEKIMPTIAPAETLRISSPTSVAEISRWSRMLGMRLTQAAAPSPLSSEHDEDRVAPGLRVGGADDRGCGGHGSCWSGGWRESNRFDRIDSSTITSHGRPGKRAAADPRRGRGAGGSLGLHRVPGLQRSRTRRGRDARPGARGGRGPRLRRTRPDRPVAAPRQHRRYRRRHRGLAGGLVPRSDESRPARRHRRGARG